MNSILRFVGLPAVENRAYTNKTHSKWVKEEVRLRGRKLV
jgi:hypothetical protein